MIFLRLINNEAFVVDKMITEALPVDLLMIDRWTNQWLKQLGFNNDQLTKRNIKVEQFSRVYIFIFGINFKRLTVFLFFIPACIGSYKN